MVELDSQLEQSYDFVTKHYFDTGHALGPKCLIVMPVEPKRKLQKFAVSTGKTLQYWEYKKGEPVKTFESEALSQEISIVINSGVAEKATVFMASGQCITGVTRQKGKQFFQFQSPSHIETIRSLHVQGTFLWTAGDFTLNCYESTKSRIEDRYYYTSDERINDMLVLGFPSEQYYSMLACNDSTIRMIGPDGTLQYTSTFSSPVTAVISVGMTQRQSPLVCFGLRNGTIGALEATIGEDQAVILWEVEPELGQNTNSPVSILKLFDNGQSHLVVARENGSLEIYRFDEKQCSDVVYQTKEKETIAGIACGLITSA